MIERIYRALLRLFPRDFRERFGDEIVATAAEQSKNAVGVRAQWRALVDAVATASRLHADARADGRTAPSETRRRTMEFILQDLAFALRSLRRDRTFTAFAVATLALGIGANAAMFGIADRLLVRGPDHVLDPGRVVRLYMDARGSGGREYTADTFGNVTLDLMRERTRVADREGIAGYTNSVQTLGSGPRARAIHVSFASANLFPMLGASAAIGRFYNETEDSPDVAQHVVVIGMALWRGQLGGTEDVIGRRLTINDEEYTVIGVAPAGFTGAELGPVDAWAPLDLIGPRVIDSWRTGWNGQWFKIVMRLRPGVTFEQVAAATTAAHRAAYSGDEKGVAAGRLRVAPLSANDDGVEATDVTIVRWLAAVALVVLLIACANVVNLLLARGAHRGRELVIRAALGASRARLVRLMLLESMLLAVAGGLLGIGLAYAIGGSARRLLFAGVDWPASPIDLRVLLAAGIVIVATGFVVGLIPAAKASKFSVAASLKTTARDGGVRHGTLRVGLTVAQSALSVALLVGAGLFVRSLWNVRTLHLGIDADRILRVEVNRPAIGKIPDGPARDAERTRRRSFYGDAAERIRGLPGVQHTAVSVGLPFSYRFGVSVRPTGMDSMPRVASGGPSVSAVSYDYFATVGTRIVEGRSFTPADRAGSERVAIVSSLMARTAWPGKRAVGQCLQVFTDSLPCTRVVGVAEDTHRARLRENPPMHFYVPLGQEVGIGGSALLVRGVGSPATLIGDVRKALFGMDPTITFATLAPVQDLIDPQVRPWRLGAIVFALTGALALLVAAIGIYSVTSYFVTERKHEMGIRIALGAGSGRVIALVARGAMGMALVGVAVGVGIAFAAARFVQPLLFDESAYDPAIFVAVAALLSIVALAASIIPATSAGRIDPLDALRAE